LCPFAAFENFMLLMLVPLFCASSGLIADLPPEKSNIDVFEHATDAVSQAASLAGLMLVLSIVREPLSYCSISFPGTSHGQLTILKFSENAFLPMGIIAQSAGALLLLGYIVCLYQYSKGNKGDY